MSAKENSRAPFKQINPNSHFEQNNSILKSPKPHLKPKAQPKQTFDANNIVRKQEILVLQSDDPNIVTKLKAIGFLYHLFSRRISLIFYKIKHHEHTTTETHLQNHQSNHKITKITSRIHQGLEDLQYICKLRNQRQIIEGFTKISYEQKQIMQKKQLLQQILEISKITNAFQRIKRHAQESKQQKRVQKQNRINQQSKLIKDPTKTRVQKLQNHSSLIESIKQEDSIYDDSDGVKSQQVLDVKNLSSGETLSNDYLPYVDEKNFTKPKQRQMLLTQCDRYQNLNISDYSQTLITSRLGKSKIQRRIREYQMQRSKYIHEWRLTDERRRLKQKLIRQLARDRMIKIHQIVQPVIHHIIQPIHYLQPMAPYGLVYVPIAENRMGLAYEDVNFQYVHPGRVLLNYF